MSYTYNYVPTKISLYRVGDNPLFGESVTDIELADEAGGMFLTITQHEGDFGPGGTLRFDFDEIVQLMKAVDFLKKVADTVNNEPKDGYLP